MHNMIR